MGVGWIASVAWLVQPPHPVPTPFSHPYPSVSKAKCLPRASPASPRQGSLAQVALGQGAGFLPRAAEGTRLDPRLRPHGRSFL